MYIYAHMSLCTHDMSVVEQNGLFHQVPSICAYNNKNKG